MSILPELDPKNRLIKFWNAGNPASWPRARSDMACIFEAIQIVGRAKHGASWDGSEFNAVQWWDSPESERDRLGVERAKLERDARIAATSPPASLARLQGGATIARNPLNHLPQPYSDHVKAWHFDQRQKRWAANNAAFIRLLDSVEWLAQRCRDGQLQSYARPSDAGQLWPMFDWEWNAENVLEKIISTGGGLRYFAEMKHTWNCYVFFARTDVERLTLTFHGAPASVAMSDLSRLSPYLRFAVSLALREGWVEGAKIPSTKERGRVVRTAWTEAMPDVPFSSGQIKIVSDAVGWPDVPKIKAGMQRGQKNKLTPTLSHN